MCIGDCGREPCDPRVSLLVEDDRTAMLKRLGKNIRILRIEREIAQEELAARAGVHRTHMTKIEGGSANSSALTLYRIARGLDVPLAELFTQL